MRERPIGPLSLVVWCRPSKIKSDDDKQRSRSLQMSMGVSLVLDLRSASASSLHLMMSMQSLMGTDGKCASVPKEIIRSLGSRVRVLMWATNSAKFLQAKGLDSMRGLRRELR
jgi:hypothetical protein